MKATATRARPSRPADDRLMLIDEIATYSGTDRETLRYRRHVGGDNAPPLWKQGRRLVAWRSEIDAWLDAQRDADRFYVAPRSA